TIRRIAGLSSGMSEYGSGGGGVQQRQRRSAASAASARSSLEEELQHLQLQHPHHYMEDPDLDVSSIVTEFVPLEDPFVPYFDATGEEMESELCAPLEASFASSIGDRSGIGAAPSIDRMYARFRPQPAGYPPNTSTPRFFADEQRVEVARGTASGTSPQRLEDALAELMDAPGGAGALLPRPSGSPQLLRELSPSARLFQEPPPPPPSMLEQFLHSISRLVSDAAYARTTHCFRSKIPREVSDDTLISFLTHCVRYPMRRPLHTLLQARTSPLVLEQVLKTAIDPQAEPYDRSLARNSYFRITLKNSVHSLAQLYKIVRGVSLGQRGFIEVNYSAVRGRLAFHGYNGNLPIRMYSPIEQFVQNEVEARQQLSALFSTEITLARCDDDAREVYITYFDNLETHPRSGHQSRVTEVNIYHIVHPSPVSSGSPPQPSSSMTSLMASPPPPASSKMTTMTSCPPPQPLPLGPPPQPLRSIRGGGRGVTFGASPPRYHEVHVERPMRALAHLMEPTYTLSECFQLARSYPQHKW
ncbi:hypothetical protein PENTCL1PPCAC_9987, partial [Pristionchus entomophagus]